MSCVNNLPIPNQGYWKMNVSADIVAQCPNFDSCNLEANGNSQICSQNSEGNLCSQCEEGFSKVSEAETC